MNQKQPTILILFAHPALEKSRVNRHLIASVKDLPGVTIHDLYEVYPDFQIDVKHEQALLAEHDILIVQHPFYWYSAPALVKEWLDLVLEHGYAYGKEGKALTGKTYFHAITTGGPQEAYHPQGHNRFTMRHLLSPYEQTAFLCGMKYLSPFVVHKSLVLNAANEVEPFAKAYRRLLELLLSGELDLNAAQRAERINDLMTGHS